MASGPTAPELILPSEWLPVIWGGEEQFALNHNASRLSNSSQRAASRRRSSCRS